MTHLRATRSEAALAYRPTLWFGRGCSPAVLRPLQPEDAGAFGDFVHALSPAARHSRFHASVRELPPSWLRALTQPAGASSWALVAMTLEGRQPRCIAEARYVADEASPYRGEIALAVADAWQGQGLASELLRRLSDHATHRGLQILFGDVLHDNLPMLRLARSQGFATAAHPTDPCLLRIVRRLDWCMPARGTVVPRSEKPDAQRPQVPWLN